MVVEGPRVLRVLRKMVKGIHYHERGERLEDADLLIFRDQDVGKDFETLTRSWSEMDMGEEFRYRSQYDENGGGLWLEFYRTNWWFVLLGDVARDYPIRPSKS